MTLDEFKQSLSEKFPPKQMSPLLKSLWYDGKNDWDEAHNIAQEIHSDDGSWVHAYLHRKEGDISNASYWYHHANKPVSRCSLEKEWEDIVKTFLEKIPDHS